MKKKEEEYSENPFEEIEECVEYMKQHQEKEEKPAKKTTRKPRS